MVDYVTSIMEDKNGHLWFRIRRGIIRYDGVVIQDLRKRDGLPDNWVNDIFEDHNGTVWIATDGGLIQYLPRHTPPPIHLTDVIADMTVS